MDMQELAGEGWVPTYEGDDVTDVLHDAFELRADYEIVTNRQMGLESCRRAYHLGLLHQLPFDGVKDGIVILALFFVITYFICL